MKIRMLGNTKKRQYYDHVLIMFRGIKISEQKRVEHLKERISITTGELRKAFSKKCSNDKLDYLKQTSTFSEVFEKIAITLDSSPETNIEKFNKVSSPLKVRS